MMRNAHRATTAQLGAAYPFATGKDLGPGGIVIGRNLFGGAFTYDPFDLYGRGVLSNPNMLVVGQIGRGKSSFVKSYLWRAAAFGRRAWVVDPKGEYGPLAEAWGVEPIKLRPHGHVRLNPLDQRAGGARLDLAASLAETSLDRALLPRERTAIELALSAVSPRAQASGIGPGPAAPTLPTVVQALLDPSPSSAKSVYTDVGTLINDGRDVALELRRMVHGDLGGMFDGPTTPGIDLDAPLVVLDLSAVYGSAALGILMTCATAWLSARLSEHDGQLRLFVVDEAWAILANLGIARWLQAAWKLSRAHGVANMAILHHLSDLAATGANGSEAVKLAQGLLSDSETVVSYAQPRSEVERSAELLGLTGAEAQLLPRLGRGVSLWKVGRQSFLVEHHLSTFERRLVDTDAAMAGSPR